MSPRFLIVCKSLVKYGVLDIQVIQPISMKLTSQRHEKIMLRGFYVEFVQRSHVISMVDHSK